MKPGDEESEIQASSVKHQQSLYRVIVWATAISFGGMAAFLFSLRHMRDDPTLEFSYRTVIAFVIGAILGRLFWKGVEHLERKNRGG